MNTANEEITRLQNQLQKVTQEKLLLEEKLKSVIEKNESEFKSFTQIGRAHV